MIEAKRVDYFTSVDKALIRSILYFDIFSYPITAAEARAFASFSIGDDCERLLDNLVSQGILFRHRGFYSVRNDEGLVIKRLEGNRLATLRMKTARKYSRLIASFPFVRAVMLSGSISKNFMDETSDIDYFIVTEAKRLWIVRTALVVFRRIFFHNSIKNFCVNYFVDTENLLIPDENLFAAIEICTLKSMHGRSTIVKFRETNQWTGSFLPQMKFDDALVSEDRSTTKYLFERLLSILPLEWINGRLMKTMRLRWKRRYSELVDEADFDTALRTRVGVSKCHPRFMQKIALERLSNKIQTFELQHGIDLSI